MNQKKNLTFLNVIAIMSAYVFAVGIMAINPTIQKLIETFPEIPISTIKMASTLPSLMSSGVMIIIGFIVGRKLSYKTVLLLANVCLFVGGSLPVLFHSNFYSILAARAVFGLGIGGIGCRNSLVIASFDEENRVKYMGYGIFVSNVCGFLMQIVSGILTDVGLKQSFYVYVIAIVPFLLITFFLKEPEHITKAVDQAKNEKLTINKRVWLYVAVGFVWCLLCYSIMTNMSTFVQSRGLGTAAVAGSILSLYTLGGAVSGFLSSRMYKVTKRFFIPLCFATAAIGELIVLLGFNIPMIGIGTALAGGAWYALNPHIMSYTGIVAGKTSMAFCTSITLAATQVGVFFSSYLCAGLGTIFTDNIIATKYAAIIGFGSIAVLFTIFDIRPKEIRDK